MIRERKKSNHDKNSAIITTSCKSIMARVQDNSLLLIVERS